MNVSDGWKDLLQNWPTNIPRGGIIITELEQIPFVEFRTSGTTGEGQPVVKALRHLEDEIAALDERLGPALEGDTRIFATASHQHIYGLLFRLLWPLASTEPYGVSPGQSRWI